MNRRRLLLAAPAAVVLAGAGVAPAAAAAPSPILDAARQLAVLDRQHEAADVLNPDHAALDAIWERVRAQERIILDAAPMTILEAAVIVMVAAGNLDEATCLDVTGATVDRATHAAARAVQFLAGTAGVAIKDFGGGIYLPDSSNPASMGRAA